MSDLLMHKTVAAETETITDEGIFTALVSVNYTEDRERDLVAPGAFAATIQRWRASKKMLPLAIDHSTAPEDVVGVIDPNQMQETDLGLVVGGEVDLESPRGPAAWRAMKSGAFGFSIGFLVQASRSRGKGKGRILEAVDLFEVSLTASPMVFESRVLSTKSMSERYALPDGRVVDYETMVVEGPKVAAQRTREKKAAQPIQIATFRC